MASPNNSSSHAAQSLAIAPGISSASTQPQASQGTDDTVDAHAQVGAKRKLRSKVWDEFEKKLIDGKWKAICFYCQKHLSADTRSGTSHLNAHLLNCGAKNSIGPTQQKLRLTKGGDGKINVENYIFDQEVARKELSLMICVHEYPLSMVDHAVFRKFCCSLQPMFKMVSRKTIRTDILNLYEIQKNSMVKYFANFKNRVAITSNLWTAGHQRKGYMAVTAHFIDETWNLKTFLMRFICVPCPHTSEVICEYLHDCLVEWHLERKISTITLDNCTSNDKAVEHMQDKLDSSSLMLQGRFIHMRCSAHILNLIVKDGMSVMESGIERVRDSVAFWTATPKRHEKFEKMAHTLSISYNKRLFLDCKTRWNSTYLMLSVALQYQEVFSV